PLVRSEHADRLAALDQERLVVAERAELTHDRIEGGPAPSRPSGAAVHDQRIGVLRDLRIEVVHEHPERRLLLPAAAAELRPARRADGPCARQRSAHEGTRRLSRSTSPKRPAPSADAETTTTCALRKTWYVCIPPVQLVMTVW